MKSRIVQPAASFQPPETCTEHEECQAAQASHNELCDKALAHYEEISAAAHHWNSLVPRAIEFYKQHGDRASLAAVPNHALVQLLESALLHPETAEGNIRQVIETLSLAAVDGDWQPIATVPKNGDEVLLAHANSQWLDQWISDVTGDYAEGGYWMMCDQWEDPETPTHWKPQSALPNAAASSPLPAAHPGETADTCGPARPDDGSECAYGFCPRPRDGCSQYCVEHHDVLCTAPAEPRQEGEQEHPYFIHVRTCASCGSRGLCAEGLKLYNSVTAAAPPETPVVAREFAREWMNTHHASFETNQEREDALAAIITRYLVGTPSPETPPNHALVQLLNSALLHPETAEGNIRQVIETLSVAPVVADDVEGEK